MLKLIFWPKQCSLLDNNMHKNRCAWLSKCELKRNIIIKDKNICIAPKIVWIFWTIYTAQYDIQPAYMLCVHFNIFRKVIAQFNHRHFDKKTIFYQKIQQLKRGNCTHTVSWIYVIFTKCKHNRYYFSHFSVTHHYYLLSFWFLQKVQLLGFRSNRQWIMIIGNTI